MWHVAQSFLKTAWRSTLAIAIWRMRSASVNLFRTGGRMLICTIKSFEPSDVATCTVLTMVPNFPARFTVTPISPFVPGATVQGSGGNCAVVQPQEGWTCEIMTGNATALVNQTTLVSIMVLLEYIVLHRGVVTGSRVTGILCVIIFVPGTMTTCVALFVK